MMGLQVWTPILLITQLAQEMALLFVGFDGTGMRKVAVVATFLVVSREQGDMLYWSYTGMIFPYSLLTTSKQLLPNGHTPPFTMWTQGRRHSSGCPNVPQFTLLVLMV